MNVHSLAERQKQAKAQQAMNEAVELMRQQDPVEVLQLFDKCFPMAFPKWRVHMSAFPPDTKGKSKGEAGYGVW